MELLKSKDVTSVYIHIPFCIKKCNYCAFTSFAGLNFIEDYIKKLTAEIKYFYTGTPLKTLYIGGGTPSLLNIKQFDKILSLFNYEKNCEITVELNPESTDLKLLSALKNSFVNRLSIGIQSFDDDILKTIGRRHLAKDGENIVNLALDIGFENISIDLMYGLPGQNLKNWEKTLEIAKTLNVNHISLYGLKIEKNTYFYTHPPKHLPDEDIQADMYEFAIKYLTPEFSLYEISNFARSNEFASKHNLNYWNEGKYFGFGVSSSGFVNNIRYKNTSNYKKYISNPLNTKDLQKLTEDEKLEETIFLGLRKAEGINIKEINKKFNIDFMEKYGQIIEKFINSRHIAKTENGIKLTIKGVLVSNSILCEFLC